MSIKACLLLYNTHKQLCVVILGRVLIKQDSVVVLFIFREACSCCHRKERTRRGNEIFVQVQWMLGGRDTFSQQPTSRGIQTPYSVLSPIFSLFFSGQGYASYRKTLGKGLGNRETLSSNCWLSITTHKTNP